MEDYYLRVNIASDLKKPKERILYRALEILPGFLSWAILILVILLSWLKPVWIGIFIISFVIYWLIRTIYFSFHLYTSYQRMKENEKINWLKKLENLKIQNPQLKIKNWKDIYHLVVLPAYKEPIEILREVFQALEKTDYPKNKMIVVLGCEERAGKHAKKIARIIQQEFGKSFFKLLVTFHPSNLPGEIPAKCSNETYAAKKAKEEILDLLKIPYENIIYSSFDADTRVFPKYFSCLTYYYLTSKKPTRTSFQPIPFYLNNLWQAPAVSRVFSFSSTFWHTINQQRPEKLITFSSHSMSFAALVEVGFKQTNVVSDDSRIFWQCFLKFNGDYRVQPIFYPVSMDANVAPSFLKTLINLYRQQKRWAYGVGDIPYFLFGFLKNKKIPFFKKINLGFELIEGHLSWATASLLMLLLGWLPLILGGEEFNQTLFSYNLPIMTRNILTLAMIGVIGSIYFSFTLALTHTSEKGNFLQYISFALCWFLIPLAMIVFVSFPALDAQTRWMCGKYMGFWPTEKFRRNFKEG